MTNLNDLVKRELQELFFELNKSVLREKEQAEKDGEKDEFRRGAAAGIQYAMGVYNRAISNL